MFDPLRMAETVKKTVCRNGHRKYYRFRPARFYGGIATADCLGCILRCAFCWSWKEVVAPDKYGRFYSPQEVADRLVSIAQKKGFNLMRISGNEPTLCREHLLSVLELIPKDYTFILETNAILIGADRTYAKDLARFPNLYVRVSLKGTCEEEFSRLTGAVPEGFALQLMALEHLASYGMNVQPACMVSFSSEKNVVALRSRLKEINPSFRDLEIEELILYPAVERRLSKLHIQYRTGYRPDGIPVEQI